jgi:hypothetical protein
MECRQIIEKIKVSHEKHNKLAFNAVTSLRELDIEVEFPLINPTEALLENAKFKKREPLFFGDFRLFEQRLRYHYFRLQFNRWKYKFYTNKEETLLRSIGSKRLKTFLKRGYF